MPLLDPKENPGDSPRHSETPYDVLWVQGGGEASKGSQDTPWSSCRGVSQGPPTLWSAQRLSSLRTLEGLLGVLVDFNLQALRLLEHLKAF